MQFNDFFVYISDDYGQVVPNDVSFVKGRFLEKSVASTKYQMYTLSKRITHFYSESVVYPFVSFEATKKGFKLTMNDYTDILQFVEDNSYAHI